MDQTTPVQNSAPPIPQTQPPATPPSQPQNNLKSKGSIVIITILLILVMLAGFLVYKFMGKYNAVPSTQSGSSKILPKQDSAMKASPAATVDADLNNVDQTLSNLDTDLKSVDESVNDKIGDLTEN